MKSLSYDIVADAIRKFWKSCGYPMDVVAFFYQAYDQLGEPDWEWMEEVAFCESSSDMEKILFNSDFCEGQTRVKDITIIPLSNVTSFYTDQHKLRNDARINTWTSTSLY